MTVWTDPNELRRLLLGSVATKAYPTLAVETKTLFNVTGGLVVITGIVGLVTTALTVADTVKLQANPTTGTTKDLCAATDLGTTDSPAGNLISFQGLTGDSALTGPGAVPFPKQSIVVATGTVEQVTTGAGADGGITWYFTWIPLDDGAVLAAA
jgi:hypothetical protein